MRARVAVFARSDKVAGVAWQLGLAVVPGMGDPAAILSALREAHPVLRETLLALADKVRGACESFFTVVGGPQMAKPD